MGVLCVKRLKDVSKLWDFKAVDTCILYDPDGKILRINMAKMVPGSKQLHSSHIFKLFVTQKTGGFMEW